MKEVTSRIIIQYILSIAALIVCTFIMILTYRGYISIFEMLFSFMIVLSSNCCSIACTIEVLKKDDEDYAFQNNRTIIIVLSLALYLMLTFVNSFFLPNIQIPKMIIVFLIATPILGYIVFFLIKMQTSVELANIDIKSRFIDPKKKDEYTLVQTEKQVNFRGEKYNIEGGRNEN